MNKKEKLEDMSMKNLIIYQTRIKGEFERMKEQLQSKIESKYYHDEAKKEFENCLTILKVYGDRIVEAL